MATREQGQGAQRPGEFGFGAWKAVGIRVRQGASRDHLSIVSAGVAFYAFLALFPALAALVSIYGIVAQPQDVQQVVDSAGGVIPPEVAGIVSGQLRSVAGNSASALGVGVVLGMLIALWSATKGTKSLMTALNIAYEEEEDRGFFRLNAVAFLLTLAAIVGAVIAIALVVALPAILGNLGLPSGWQGVIAWVRWPILAVALVLALALFYRFGPSRRPAQWSWVSYGAVLATVLWLIASGLFSWYVSNFGSYNETYGSMAAVAILLLWFYISAYVVLLGAELNSEMERQTARDTTVGQPRARGRRGARMANRVAGEDDDQFKA